LFFSSTSTSLFPMQHISILKNQLKIEEWFICSYIPTCCLVMSCNLLKASSSCTPLDLFCMSPFFP
jgi:hypothetical protein